MSCEEFRDRLMEYIEEELSAIEMQEMEQHIKLCSHCRKAYERRVELICTFDEVINDESITFNSRKNNIMSSIDKDKYKKPPVNKLKQIILNNKKYMVQVAAAVLIIAIIPVVLKNTGVIGGNGALGYKATSKDGVVGKLENKAEANKEGAPGELVMEGDNLELGALSDDNLSARLSYLREDSSLKLKAWTLEYADSDYIVFSNYNNIVVYSQLHREVINLIKIDSIKTQEVSPQMKLKVSADGNYAFVGANTENGQILLLDLRDGRHIGVGSGSLEDIEISWSAASNWAAAYDEVNKQLLVYDILGNESLTLKDKLKEPMEKVYIGNEGSVVLQGKESYLLKAPDYTQSTLLLGRAIGFKGDSPLSIKEGIIYSNSEKGAEYFMTLEGDYASVDFYQQGDKLLFDYQGVSQVLDLDSKAITEDYPSDSAEKLITGNFISQVDYIDKDTLVYVALIDNPKTIGQFRIIKYNIKTREKTVLYDNSI